MGEHGTTQMYTYMGEHNYVNRSEDKFIDIHALGGRQIKTHEETNVHKHGGTQIHTHWGTQINIQ